LEIKAEIITSESKKTDSFFFIDLDGLESTLFQLEKDY
ncbi:MAG: hypothetical protein UR54_C0006G0001, partial [Candidatus Roizmanbacteria bacterium GW2011_GWA2_34_18]